MALQLLDEYGLPDLTMRNLATALGVQPSALYWRFPNKQALLAAVGARILAPLAELPIEEDLGVHEAVRVLGARLRNCLLTYRDASELVSGSLSLRLVGSPVRPQVLEVARTPRRTRCTVRGGRRGARALHRRLRLPRAAAPHADSLGLLEASDSLNPEEAVAATSDEDSFAKALTMIADGLDVSVTRGAGPHG